MLSRRILGLSHRFYFLNNQTVIRNAMSYYAVKRGKETGVFRSWKECEEQVKGYIGARYKKFASEEEAEAFVEAPHSPGKAPKASGHYSPYGYGGYRKQGYSSGYYGSYSNSAHSSHKYKSHSGSSRYGCQSYGNYSSYGSKSTKYASVDYSSSDSDEEYGACSYYYSAYGRASGKHKVVYTDGCCFFNGKHGATAGIGVFWGQDDDNNISEKIEGKQTNNKAEITAARRAIEQAKEMGLDSLEIRTDSQFMIDCATKWMQGWKKKDWKKSDGAEVKNKEELQELDAASEGLDITWVHVEAHAGHEGNEEADKLAKQGAKKHKE